MKQISQALCNLFQKSALTLRTEQEYGTMSKKCVCFNILSVQQNVEHQHCNDAER